MQDESEKEAPSINAAEAEDTLLALGDLLNWDIPMGPQADLRWIGETPECLYLVYFFPLAKQGQSASEAIWLLVRTTNDSTYYSVLCATETQAKWLAERDAVSTSPRERERLRQQLNEFVPGSCLFWYGNLAYTDLEAAFRQIRTRCGLNDSDPQKYSRPEF